MPLEKKIKMERLPNSFSRPRFGRLGTLQAGVTCQQ